MDVHPRTQQLSAAVSQLEGFLRTVLGSLARRSHLFSYIAYVVSSSFPIKLHVHPYNCPVLDTGRGGGRAGGSNGIKVLYSRM